MDCGNKFQILLKMKKINIEYLTTARIPTEKAHGHQILEMCQSLSNIDNINLQLNIPNRFNHLTCSIQEWYGENFAIKIKKIPVIDYYGINIKSNLMQKINYILIVVSYCLNIALNNASSQYYFIREPLLYFFVLPISFFKKIKIIYEVHSLPEGRIRRYLFCWLLRRADILISLTPILKKILVLIYGCDGRKIITLTDSVNKNFLLTNNLLNNNDVIKVCYMGRLSSKNVSKGVELICEAFSSLKSSRLIEFHLYGADQNEIANLCDLNKLKTVPKNIKIHIHGNIKYSTVPLILANHHILIAIYSSEDFHNRYCVSPLKIFEYMASGKLILASDIPAFYGVLKNKKNSLLFKNKVSSISICIQHAIDNFSSFELLGNSARKDAFNNTWDIRAEKIYKCLIQ